MAMAIFLSLLMACSGIETQEVKDPEDDNFNQTGMPIVDDPVTLKFMTGQSSLTAQDYNDVLVWEEYEKKTNIHIDWGLTPNEELDTKIMLDLVTGEHPEAYYATGLPVNSIYEYGQHGTLLKLNDFIDDYMPNLKQILETYPDIKKGITFPDGGIYSLPTIHDPEFTSLLSNNKPFIKKEWLEKLDMDIPETTDAYYDYLKAVKETDLSDNNKGDEVPFSAMNINHLYNYLKGSFGIGNRGSHHQHIDVDPETDELRFFPMTDEYKQLVEYMNKLYTEELIDDRIYTMDDNKFLTEGSQGLYGSTILPNADSRLGLDDEYVGMPALEGPNGEKSWNFIKSPLSNMSGFMLTDKNENIAATLRWMDYFYGDEGARLFFMGIEDETYEVAEDGTYKYVDDLTDEEDLSLDHRLSPYFTYIGGGYAGLMLEKYFNGDAGRPSSIAATEKLEPDMIDEVWLPFTYTDDELSELANIQVDIDKYVDEMRAKLIVGQESFDEWDAYLAEFEKMELDKYMEIQEQAYERYKE